MRLRLIDKPGFATGRKASLESHWPTWTSYCDGSRHDRPRFAPAAPRLHALFDAMNRLFDDRPQRTDGCLIKNNLLYKEATNELTQGARGFQGCTYLPD